MTTFRQCVVPPPMCSFELQLPSPVNQVTFLCRPQRTNQLAALTSDGQISIYSQGGSFLHTLTVYVMTMGECSSRYQSMLKAQPCFSVQIQQPSLTNV